MKEIAIKVPIETPSRLDVYQMFNRISRRYDLLNRILSLGMDCYWRRAAIRELDPQQHRRVLDLACGTGDIAMAAAEADSRRLVIGVDRADAMLALANRKSASAALSQRVSLVQGDGMRIPAATSSIDAATIAFGIRNMSDTVSCLRELQRVLRTGGKVIILEFSLPRNKLFRSLHLFYLRRIVPFLGGAISGDGYAYSYLNQTIETYPCGEMFCRLLKSAGFGQIVFRPLSMGIVTIYTGIKD
jgi:demethylmenaquinone methyltransferase / 2-methoxy-6-polyprenyl-1,4-benzoquinol methylase